MTLESPLKHNLTTIVQNDRLPAGLRESAQAILAIGFTTPPGIGGSGLSAREMLNVNCLSRQDYVRLASNFRQQWMQASMQLGTNHPDLPRETAHMLRTTSELLNGQDNRSPERVYERNRALLTASALRPSSELPSCPGISPAQTRPTEPPSRS